MSKILNLICIPIITIALYACSDPSQPEILEGKDLETVQAPYYIKGFLVIKGGENCLLKTTSVFPTGQIVNKSWAIDKDGKVFLFEDDSAVPLEDKTLPVAEEDQMYAEYQQAKKRKLEMQKIQQEIQSLKALLSAKSIKTCHLD